MRQSQLEKADNIKDLGVTFDDNLKFTDHVNEKTNKAYGMLGIIKRNFKGMSRNCLIMLYKSMVRSHLEYANNVWNPVKKEILKILKRYKKDLLK